jgi:hypothetical protein
LSWHTFGSRNGKGSQVAARNPLNLLEAAIGIEPMNKGFADLCLTTWLRRLKSKAEGGRMKSGIFHPSSFRLHS